jgi:hypothetical protein
MVLRRQRIDPNEATSRVWQNRCITKELVQWRMNEVNAVGHQRIDPNEATSRSLAKSMHQKELVQWRMNEVNAVVHQRIDPNGGDQPSLAKSMHHKAGGLTHEPTECGSPPGMLFGFAECAFRSRPDGCYQGRGSMPAGSARRRLSHRSGTRGGKMARFSMCVRMATVIVGLIQLAGAAAYADDRNPAPQGAKVFFVDLKDGQTIPSKSVIRFGISGMELAPAGTAKVNTGHHHLLIDTPMPPADMPIPSDFNHLHFGKGQTEVELTLTGGEHTLQLLLADHNHVPHNPPVVSQVIRVVVDAATVQKTRSPAPAGAKVFFIGLEEGARLGPKVTVQFGISGMEVAPAGTEKPHTGHHHLLVDAPLPPLDREIPSDHNHVHFGRGQTSTELTLTPGEHTLQLLLADHEHIPHEPPVMSARIRVHVADVAGGAGPAVAAQGRQPSPPDAAVYFVYPRDGEVIYPRSTIRFGLRNMGVAPAGIAKPDTGHHHLVVDAETPPLDAPIPSDPNHMHFGGGQTEVKLTLPPGKHTLQLILADDQHVPHDPPVMSERITVTVGNPRNARAKRSQRPRSARR